MAAYQVPTTPADRPRAQAAAREALHQVAAKLLGVPPDHPWAHSLALKMLDTGMTGWDAFQVHRASSIELARDAARAAACQ
jgi:hypothetical protein